MTHIVEVKCKNCGWKGAVEISIEGEVDSKLCPYCRSKALEDVTYREKKQ